MRPCGDRRPANTGGPIGKGRFMIDVAAAIIIDEKKRVLIARRRPGLFLEGFWEFPGGKIEPGETAEKAMERELKEEMNLSIEAGKRLGESVHAYERFTVRLIAHYARIKGGNLRLTDHDRWAWVFPEDLSGYAMPPADEPLRRMLLDNKQAGA